MSRTLFVIAVSIGATLVAQGPETRPEFEAGIIKAADPLNLSPGVQTGRGILNGGGFVAEFQLLPSGIFRAHNVPLIGLVTLAYGTREEAVMGVPAWFRTYRFDVAAKCPENTSREEMAPMLQVLPEHTFLLSVHRESREMDAFVLQRASGALALRKTVAMESNCKTVPGAASANVQHLACTNMTMARFAAALPRISPGYVDRTVVDETGLEGSWDFVLDWSSPAFVEANGGTNLFAAVAKLGLRLSERKARVSALVIDHSEKLAIAQ